MTTSFRRKWLVIGFTAAGCCLFGTLLWRGLEDRSAWRAYSQGEHLLENRETREEGMRLIDKASERLSDDPEFLQKYGRLLDDMGRKQEAAAAFEKALRLKLSPGLMESLAMVYLQIGEYEQASAMAEKELDILPWKLTPRFILASVHAEQGSPEEAFAYALDTVLTPMKARSSRGMHLKRQARGILAESMTSKTDPGEMLKNRLAGALDHETRRMLDVALAVAGDNRDEMLESLAKSPDDTLPAIVFLLTNMPEQDLRSLDADYLLKNCQLAFQVRGIWPFMPEIPDEVFLNYLLPYAQAGEGRDDWRTVFLDKYLPVVDKCKSVGEIVLALQAWIPLEASLKFDHENHSDSFWSVGKTLENKLGDCINFSILLADACRAVGVPARLATIPSWVGVRGGHSWVEVYDQGRWRHISAFDPSPLDQTWFEERVSNTDPTRFRHRVYGASFRRTDIQLQLYGPNVWWTDETERYVANKR